MAEAGMPKSGMQTSAGARTVLSVRNLSAWYGELQALFGVSFHIGQGEVLGLTGRNGAGKTTTLRAIMGLVSRQAGAVSFMGRDVSALPPYARARLGIGYCPEERAIFSSLTVRENLALPPGVAPDPISEADLFRLFPNLKNRLHHHGGQLSGGEQQMLAIARILRTGARMLIFDEPTEGLAPVLVAAIERVLRELKSRGYTILLVEQNLNFVLRLADRVVLIERGTVVDEGVAGSETSRKRLAEQLAL
jgi:branched-chain amino acid transport system ATP-binding protein